MKRFIFLLVFIFTFGLCILIPSKCASYENANTLNYTNRLMGITYSQASFTYRLDINNENYNTSTRRYTIQAFNKDDLYHPINISSLPYFNAIGIVNSDANMSMTLYQTNNNYAYYYSSTATYNYIYIRFSNSNGVNSMKDVVFNITLTNSACYLGTFVPNTYYNVGGENNLGFMQYYKVELCMESVSTARDVSSVFMSYNTIKPQNINIINEIADNNNRNTYQYYLRVYFNDLMISNIPNFNIKFMELTRIKANNTLYNTYQDAINNLPWLYNNIVLYNDSATLYNTQSNVDNNKYDTIEYIEFRIADYTFKSSSYYNSNIGINGYIANMYISTLNGNEIDVSSQAYENGFLNGKNTGYLEGYEAGLNSNTTSFGNMMLSVADVPIHIIYSILNFEILGTNLASLFTAFISLFLFIWLIRRFKE